MGIIENGYGKRFDYDFAEQFMDKELCEEMAANPECPVEHGDGNEQGWFDAYCVAHERRFGETWVLDTENPQF